MSTSQITDFHEQYLLTWTAPDAAVRRAAIDRVWAAHGRLFLSSAPGEAIDGTDAIAAHVGQVHDDLIAAKKLQFVYDQQAQAGEALLLRWSMLSPSGDAVGRGVDLILRDAAGRVETVYMFMGID